MSKPTPTKLRNVEPGRWFFHVDRKTPPSRLHYISDSGALVRHATLVDPSDEKNSPYKYEEIRISAAVDVIPLSAEESTKLDHNYRARLRERHLGRSSNG